MTGRGVAPLPDSLGCSVPTWVAGLLVFASVACGTSDIVVATLPVEAAGGAGSGCASNDDCEPDEFCARSSCSDLLGACELRPARCEDIGAPICGCDGISYWNDCLRRQYGATGSTAGSCTSSAAKCMVGNALDCPVLGAACGKLVEAEEPCNDQIVGSCWVLPVACPIGMPPELDLASTCNGPVECRDTCTLLRTGRPARRDQCSPGFPDRP